MKQQPVTKAEVRKLVGKQIYALKKDGSVVSGKLVRIKGSELILSNGKSRGKDKKVSVKAIIPLVLFDLLAIGTSPFAFGGGYGFPYGGGFGGGYGGFYGGGFY
ncbi:hypothetical protein MJA45_20365 [Paenibacillus aurantius]|uniref:50S ribosomal protein L33 n=1 Tax=Paenibacillus aurantius TaxID=2918900 RepID=A0AA96RDN7_9BACL|nr:hypothetical protein [Paenibacillus aurantius]WNQ09957.1 hypothetical protein MJA45_20365 [Paenibacillus aurantius]